METDALALESFQDMIQDTNEDEFALPPAAPVEAVSVVCCGDGGCGKEFQLDDAGSDGKYAMLCGGCYSKSDPQESGPTETTSEEVPLGEENDLHEPFLSVEEDSETSTTNLTGKVLGNLLNCCVDTVVVAAEDRRTFEVQRSDGQSLNFDLFEDPQSAISQRRIRFFVLRGSTTPELYGWKRYQGATNKTSGRGWLGRCKLKRLTSPEDAIVVKGGTKLSQNLYIWEFHDTRCDDPRVDLVLFDEDQTAFFQIHDGMSWLTKNQLESDTEYPVDINAIQS